MRKIKVGVIGVGIQGELHVHAYKVHPSVEEIAIADINEKRLKEIASKYGVEKTYTDYLEMLEKEELDLVSVVTPDFMHTEFVLNCLKRGVNVIVEKPLATSVEDAEKMVREARNRGLMLFVNFANRWNPPFAVTKEKLAKGELGEPVYAYIRLSDTIYVPTKMLSWASKTSVVFFLMSHTADLAMWFFDDKVESVYAVARRELLKSLGVDTYDYVVAVLEFEKGGKAVLESAWILPESLPSIVDFRCELLCSKGCVFIDDFKQRIAVAADTYSYPRYSGGYTITAGRFIGFVKEAIHHAVECLAEGKEPVVKPEEALENTKVLCAITESIEKGEKVKLR